MQKYLLYFSVLGLIMGCATSSTNSGTDTPAKIIKNPRCNSLTAVKVFDVADKFVLANGCTHGTDYCPGYVVYVKKDNNQIYYEGKVIKPENGKCFAYAKGEAFTYNTAYGIPNTVPKLMSVDSQITNPEYAFWEQRNKNK